MSVVSHWKSAIKLQLKPKTNDELKAALQTIWETMTQEHINKAVEIFIKCL